MNTCWAARCHSIEESKIDGETVESGVGVGIAAGLSVGAGVGAGFATFTPLVQNIFLFDFTHRYI